MHAVAKHDEAVYTECFAYVFNRVTRWLHADSPRLDDATVADAAQHTMQQIWFKAATYRENTNNQAWRWITTIAKNKAIDLVRIQKRLADLEPQYKQNKKIPEALKSEGPNQEDEPEYNWAQFYSKLSLQEQRVMGLLAKGFSQKEIAQKLKISEPRVSQLITQLREKADKFFKKANHLNE